MVVYHVLQNFQAIPEGVMSSGLCLKFHRFQELHKLYNCSFNFPSTPTGNTDHDFQMWAVYSDSAVQR